MNVEGGEGVAVSDAVGPHAVEVEASRAPAGTVEAAHLNNLKFH